MKVFKVFGKAGRRKAVLHKATLRCLAFSRGKDMMMSVEHHLKPAMTSKELVDVSMKIITAAGDGRALIQQALDRATNGDIAAAEETMLTARKQLTIAHNEQTHVIQEEMSADEAHASALLFSHAQDTVMTISSEYQLSRKLIQLIASFEERLAKLEKKTNETIA